jgi:dihydroneopterin aldolase
MNDIFCSDRAVCTHGAKTKLISTFVRVRDVRVDALIGVYDHEHNRRQPLLIDVDLEVRPANLDRLEQTFNYERIFEISMSLCNEHIDLIETFAYRLAAMCVQDPAVLTAEAYVTKPEALVNGTPSVKISVVSG